MTRREWMALLAKLVAPMQAAAATAALVEMLVLLEDLPPGAFTPASLEDVASKLKRVPNYAELREHLGGWWREHRQASGPALEGPPSPPPQDAWSERVARERHEAAESWRTITAVEVRAKIADVQSQPASIWAVACGVMLAGCLRKHAPHHLGLLPPAWLDDRDTAPTTAAASVKPHYLKPEVLQAERERLRREKQPA